MIDKKVIYAIDLVILLGSLVGVFFLVGYVQPLVIAPADGYTTSEGSVLFSFDNAEKVYIDGNQEFSSPEVYDTEGEFIVSLDPGTYYWKVEGVLQSEVRKLTIESRVELKVRESGNGYEVVNAGNAILNVDIYDGGVFSERVSLEPDESERFEGDKFIGGEA